VDALSAAKTTRQEKTKRFMAHSCAIRRFSSRQSDWG
jgi:hypothetical protein